jgi:dihydrofolate reductase
MRKLKLQMQLSVDGYVAGPNGELDWMSFNQDSQLLALINSLTDSSDTILLGRKMTDGFITYWENVVNNQPDSPEFSFAQKMVDTPKVVFSKTLKSIVGKNVTIENGDLATAVKNSKSKTGKDIIVYGGADFVSSLIKEGLIDEFNFFINPIMINKGLRIFDLLGERQKLSLQSATGYECGVAVLSYKLIGG